MIAVCTSVAAASMLLSRANWSVRLARPCVLLEVTSSEPGDLHELPLERRGDVVGHRVGAGARIARPAPG